MSFQKNHLVHFLITLGVIFLLATTIIWRQYNLNIDSLDLNRKISGKLIISSLNTYKDKKGEYPEKIEDLGEFIKPVPTDPVSGNFFLYKKKSATEFELIIPQDKLADIVFTNQDY